MDRIAAWLPSLRAHVREHRVQLALSLRVTIAALASFALSELLKIPLPLWTVLTAVILTQASFGRSVKATTDYLVSTILGAAYAGAIAVLAPHGDAVALAGVLAIAVAPLALLAAVRPSFNAATFTGVLVLLVPGIAHVGPIESAIYRVLEVAVGGGTALVVSLLVLPTRAHALTVDTAGRMLELMARMLPELFAGLTRTCDAEAVRRSQDSIGAALTRLDAVAAEARHEQIGFLGAGSDPGPLVRTMLRLRHDLVMIGRAAALPFPETIGERAAPSLANVAEAAADYLHGSAEALLARGPSPPLDAAEAAMDDCAEVFADLRREGLTRELALDAVERIFTMGFALDQLRQHLRDLERCAGEAAVSR
jgi:uncharacterized membrane protein YccC